jgi:hypothetical protein
MEEGEGGRRVLAKEREGKRGRKSKEGGEKLRVQGKDVGGKEEGGARREKEEGVCRARRKEEGVKRGRRKEGKRGRRSKEEGGAGREFLFS